jgi:hypothetical protein
MRAICGPILTVVFLGVFLICAGCGSEDEGDGSPRFKLILEKKPQGDAERPHIKVSVTNNSKAAIAWDKQFSVFLHWHASYEDGTPVETLPNYDVARPTEEEVNSRFVVLAPGETVSKSLDLTDAIRSFGSGTMHSREQRHAAYTGFEYYFRFSADDRDKSIIISLEYKIGMNGWGGFRAWTGRDPNAYQFFEGDAASNDLRFDRVEWNAEHGPKGAQAKSAK